jgi:hypothetical protein
MTIINYANQGLVWLCSQKLAFFFKEFLFFFKRSISGGIFLINKHMFIFNGYGAHVTLEAIEQAQTFRLDMVTLPSHTSHAL